MARASVGAVRLIDADGDALDDGNGKLNVNATTGSYSTIADGSNTDIDTSAIVLGPSAACKEVVIQASASNTGIVYVGATGVTTTTGIALNAGDAFSFNIDNIDNVYVIASANNQAVSYVYFN